MTANLSPLRLACAANRDNALPLAVMLRSDLAVTDQVEEASLLAAQDRLVPRLSSRFGVAAHRELALPADAKYCNAGVMVIDLERWRREAVAERAFAYLERFGDRVVLWDKETYNVVFAGRWGELDQRWNSNRTFDDLFGPAPSPPSPADPRVGEAPWIAHFTGRLKPWSCPSASRLQAEFEAFLAETAWAGWRPPGSWQSALVAR